MSHPTAQDKIDLLIEYGQRMGLRTLVETGLYSGNGSGMHTGATFDRYEIIDCQAENVRSARERGYRCWFGDSGELLPRVLNQLAGPALFWLDAHAITDDPVSWPGFPLHRELEAIAAWQHGRWSTVLIDDLFMFGPSAWLPLRGSGELDALRSQVEQLDLWDVAEENEIMRLTPKVPARLDLGGGVSGEWISCSHGELTGLILTFPDDSGYVSWCPQCGGVQWDLESLEPLTISPSVQSAKHHGFIQQGRWVGDS